MNKHVVTILLSNIEDRDLSLIQGDVIGVDRGCAIALKHQLALTIAIGDFDSLSPEDFNLLKQSGTLIKSFPADKNKSDAELAIDWAIQQGYQTIIVLGFSGGRLDHQQALIQALFSYKHVGIKFVTPDQTIQYLNQGSHLIQKEKPFEVFSLFALSEAIVTLNEAKYSLNKAKVDVGSIYMISNEWLDHAPAKLTLHIGEILLFRSRLL